MPETLDATALCLYGLLGPVIVTHGEHRVPLPPGKDAEKILAILLLSDGEYVTARKLSELLGITEKAVHTAIYRLHKRFESHGLKLPIHKRDNQGYRLKPEPPDQIDANRFRNLVASVPDDPEAALEHLDEALSLWRGNQLAGGYEFPGLPRNLTPELTRLRMRTRLRWCEINLDLDRPWEALPTAELLVETDPLYEPAVMSLVRAQAPTLGPLTALQTCVDYRERLAKECGAKPSARFRRLQQEIQRQLNGDDEDE